MTKKVPNFFVEKTYFKVRSGTNGLRIKYESFKAFI